MLWSGLDVARGDTHHGNNPSRNFEELMLVFQIEWANMIQHRINKILRSMSKRVYSVIFDSYMFLVFANDDPLTRIHM